ncbi:hypothetical protein ACTA71_010574 [Dictyostelium dimigraforme]
MIDLDNSILFFKIFRNLYLKEEIFKHVRLFIRYRKEVVFKNASKYISFEYKDYLSNLEYSFHQHLKIPNVEILKIGEDFWAGKKMIKSIPKGFIPPSVNNLTIIKRSQSENLDPSERLCNFIPTTVTKLDLRGYYNQLKFGDIHKTLKSLTISLMYSPDINQSIWPDELELDEIAIHDFIEIENDHFLPKNYKTIKTYCTRPDIFKTSLLSASLVKIDMMNTLSSMNLSALKNLKFVTVFEFQGNIERGFLPECLESLEIYYKQDYEIQVGSLPKSLKKLFMPYYKKKVELGVLPDGLESVALCGASEGDFEVGVFPSSITNLDFGYSNDYKGKMKVGLLPKSLTFFLFPQSYDFEIEEGLLPNSIGSLVLSKYFNQQITNTLLPNKLVHLDFGKQFNFPIPPNTLPETLNSIRFGNCFNQDIDVGCLPNSIQSIVFTSGFNKPLKVGCWPTSLITLYLGTSFNSSIEPYSLPRSLLHLEIGGSFDQYFETNSLPLGLASLQLSESYQKDIRVNLPNLKKLFFGTVSHLEYFLKGNKEYCDAELFSFFDS